MKKYIVTIATSAAVFAVSAATAQYGTDGTTTTMPINDTVPNRVMGAVGMDRSDRETSAVVSTDPENTGRNVRDRDARTSTPLDQGNNTSDTLVTARIRRAIVATEGMSFQAQNIKVITYQQRVVLRGVVKTADEKATIARIASEHVPAENVTNLLEVKGNTTSPNARNSRD